MQQKTYLVLWIALTGWLTFEYLVLNRVTSGPSVITWLYHQLQWVALSEKPSPEAGKSLSFFLGWVGFCVMCLTNLYIIRKRVPAWQKWGKTAGWLDFHIFCGLLGPTLIVFHTNLKVGGLVAVSFWAMIITAMSGILGRYLYIQLLSDRANLKQTVKAFDKAFVKYQQQSSQEISDDMMRHAKMHAYLYAGGVDPKQATVSMPFIVWSSFVGDIRTFFSPPPLPWKAPYLVHKKLAQYGIIQRKIKNLAYFNRMLGYWHSFHVPFASFMYLVAVIHIISALLFRVDN